MDTSSTIITQSISAWVEGEYPVSSLVSAVRQHLYAPPSQIAIYDDDFGSKIIIRTFMTEKPNSLFSCAL